MEKNVNNFNNISINQNPEYEVFLIKKPIEVGLGDLGILQWATDGSKEILSRSKIKLGKFCEMLENL